MSGLAAVKDKNPNVAPTLTPGKVTPEILHRWERSCKEYFRVKNVAKEKKVESIVSRLLDLRIADWVEANEETLRILEFEQFMSKLREETLEKDWDRKIKLSILDSRQGERPFHEWAYELQTRNALLRGRPGHFSEDALRETLQNNMDQSLERRIRKVKEGSLTKWIEAVEVEDEILVGERELMKEAVMEVYRREQQKGVKKSRAGRTMATSTDF